MGLRLKFNIVLIGTLLLGLLACAIVFSRVVEKNFREELDKQIEVIREHALAVRRYTSEEIRPLLANELEVQFLPQSVPSFAAHASFMHFRELYPQFSYHEAALNPTNPTDKPSHLERKLIEKLRADPTLKRISNVRSTADGEHYSVAFPLVVISQSCLNCHSTPERAPKSMIAVYGKQNGFGWKMDEIVGAQIISVPLAIGREQTWQTIKLAGVAMGTIFLVLMILLNVFLSRMVISPVTRMARVAESVSTGDDTQPEFMLSRKDEIGVLSHSFNRMRRSLKNAMNFLEN